MILHFFFLHLFIIHFCSRCSPKKEVIFVDNTEQTPTEFSMPVRGSIVRSNSMTPTAVVPPVVAPMPRRQTTPANFLRVKRMQSMEPDPSVSMKRHTMPASMSKRNSMPADARFKRYSHPGNFDPTLYPPAAREVHYDDFDDMEVDNRTDRNEYPMPFGTATPAMSDVSSLETPPGMTPQGPASAGPASARPSPPGSITSRPSPPRSILSRPSTPRTSAAGRSIGTTPRASVYHLDNDALSQIAEKIISDSLANSDLVNEVNADGGPVHCKLEGTGEDPHQPANKHYYRKQLTQMLLHPKDKCACHYRRFFSTRAGFLFF